MIRPGITNDARLAIIKYFSVVSGNENQAKKTQLSTRCIRRSSERIRLLGRCLWSTSSAQKVKGYYHHQNGGTLLKTLPEDIDQISKHWEKMAMTRTSGKWEA